MNLFARILSHGFALLVVALLAIGLIYRGELFPEYDFPDFLSLGQKPGATKQAADTDRAVIAEPAQPAAGEPSAGLSASPEPEPEIESEFMPSAAIERGIPEPVATEPAAGEPVPAVDTTRQAVTEMADETAGAEIAAVPPATQQAAPPAAEPQETAVDEAGMAAPEPEVAASTAPVFPGDAGAEGAEAAASHAPAMPVVTPYRILAAAREAYWLRDYAAAEQKYQELIALDPDNPDGYGELGNMYFSQGDWDKASASYYEAGTRLVAQGMYDRAHQLVEVIRGLNGAQAGDLEEQINAAESAAP